MVATFDDVLVTMFTLTRAFTSCSRSVLTFVARALANAELPPADPVMVRATPEGSDLARATSVAFAAGLRSLREALKATVTEKRNVGTTLPDIITTDPVDITNGYCPWAGEYATTTQVPPVAERSVSPTIRQSCAVPFTVTKLTRPPGDSPDTLSVVGDPALPVRVVMFNFVGVLTGAVGTTVLETPDVTPVPTAFVALTVKV